jgi:hypothetical protein
VKTKFRKITVDNRDYLYIKREEYSYGTILNITIYLKGYQRTPLSICFHIINNSSIIIQPLNSGIALFNSKTNESVSVNLNEPKYIREFILLGLKNGWTGTNDFPTQDGLQYLTEMGFEALHLQAPPYPAFIKPNDRFKDVLAYATIPQIHNLLEQHVLFLPMATAVLKNEAITEVLIQPKEGSPSPEEQFITALKQELQNGAANDQYLACAVFYITRTFNRSTCKITDAIAMHYEDATEANASIYYYPYTLITDKKIKYGKHDYTGVVEKEMFTSPLTQSPPSIVAFSPD